MRVKRGVTKTRKHKKVLAQTKGFQMSYSKLIKRAKEALLHAGDYNYMHRRKRQGQYRQIWIKRINAVCKQNGTSYSRFIKNLKDANVLLDRKILGFLAYEHEAAFNKLVTDMTK
jgi:large subunit ribosomal protein L20